MTGPSAEQLRTMDVRELRDNFSMGIQEAKRLKLEQKIRDNIERITDEETRWVLQDMLSLITGR